MKIAFCTTCKNRTPHLQIMLPQNLQDNPHSKFIIVNYNTEDNLLDYLRVNHSTAINSGQLVLYSHLDAPRFKMAHAKNMAHRCAMLEGADILVNLDADNITGPGFEDWITAQFSERDDIFLWANMIKGEMIRGISGRIVVTSNAFLKAGGYDEEKFDGWGSDDKDFHVRLNDLGYTGEQIPPRYLLAIPHNDKVRFREYPEAAQNQDESDIIAGRNWARVAFATTAAGVEWHTVTKAVVNNGKIGCGRVFRNFDLSTPILIKPRPTRVFGIGLHKTGTTSLHEAMGLLGYDSWHWSSAHAAKAIWREMNTTGRSPTLERYHALCDLPIPLLFTKLDAAYPGSKFILTLRDENEWLRSVEKHWNPETNKWRMQWETDPFTNTIHKVIYGQTEFDAALFLARYRRHNTYVLEYFQDRLDDLLVLHNGAGWPALCEFLDLPIPDRSYPHENSASEPGYPYRHRRRMRHKRRARRGAPAESRR